MFGKYKTIEIISFEKEKLTIHKRTTARIAYGNKVCFVCEKCKNQIIGNAAGCYEDCNNCRLISDETDTHIYCLNYEEEGENMKDDKYIGWDDGKCKLCGSRIFETSIFSIPVSEVEEKDRQNYPTCDYINRCTNKKCINHKWHPVADDEFLDYYSHNGMEGDE